VNNTCFCEFHAIAIKSPCYKTASPRAPSKRVKIEKLNRAVDILYITRYHAAMNCEQCRSYNRGYGRPACLKCQKYKDITVSSGKRRTIRIETVPQNILEAIAEDIDPKTQSIHEIIRLLPNHLSSIMALIYTAGLTQRQTAQTLNISQKQVSKNHTIAIEIIRKTIS
jgi:predicted XRE-type DNA-binding protein